MTIAIIDYGSGNLRSVAKAFERVAAGNLHILVTDSPEDIVNASHIVLPGVGAYADCMRGLTALPGMLPALEQQVRQKKKPFLGICVGMQMLFEEGHEYGVHKGLGWLKGEVIPLHPSPSGKEWREAAGEGQSAKSPHPNPLPKREGGLKIPHMGWNDLSIRGGHALMRGIQSGSHAYFVHSYHAICENDADVIATVSYGQTVTAVVGRGNIMGTQFHPEKSQETGLQLLKNFLDDQ